MFMLMLLRVCCANLIKEDFLSDEQKVSWDKNSLDDIFKTIPFFKFQPSDYNDEYISDDLSHEPTQIEELEEQNQINPKISIDVIPIMPSKTFPMSKFVSFSHRSIVNSATSIVKPALHVASTITTLSTNQSHTKMLSEKGVTTFSSRKKFHGNVSFSLALISFSMNNLKTLNSSTSSTLDFHLSTKVLNESITTATLPKHLLLSTSLHLLKPTFAVKLIPSHYALSTPMFYESRFNNFTLDVNNFRISEENIRLPDENGYGNSLGNC